MATEFKARVWRRHFRGVINALSRSHSAGVVAAAMLCLASAAVAAEADHAEGNWLTDPSSDCRVWNPSPEENETVSWSGACREGLAEGYGVVQWFQDNQQIERYEGDLRRGIQNGSGVLIRGGQRYEGQFRDGKAHGSDVLNSKGTVLQAFGTTAVFGKGMS